MNYEVICENILKTDESIRFVGIYTYNGEMIFNKMRPNTESMLTEDQIKMSMYYAKLRHETREHLEHKIGKEEFSMSKYEKLIRFTIPFERDLILISADANANYAKIIDDISTVIRDNKN
jgi:hypothetical protein